MRTAKSTSEPADLVSASRLTLLWLSDARSCPSARASIGNLSRIFSALEPCADEASVSIATSASASAGSMLAASLEPPPPPPPPHPVARAASTATAARRTFISSILLFGRTTTHQAGRELVQRHPLDDRADPLGDRQLDADPARDVARHGRGRQAPDGLA